MRTLAAIGADAVQLHAVAGEFETGAFCLCFDAPIDIHVGELGYGSAVPADQVMMVPPGGQLIADRSVFERHAAHDIEILEELHGAEYGCATDPRERRTEIFD
ncbi:MAG: hypothetical protein R3C29_11175 [Dehalococcoidia bacterium]